MRWLKRILYFFIVLIGLIGLFASLGKYYYENEVKQYVKSALNDFLDAPVDVNEIEFSLISKFPYASISFNEVLAWDAFPGKKGSDTLLYAKKIFLEFNLFDLARKKYNLREIEVVSGDFRLKWNAKGENNYVIWKENVEESDTELTVKLDKIKFKNCRLLIDHQKSAFTSFYKVNELTLKGSLESQLLKLKAKGKLSHFSYHSNAFSYSSSSFLEINTDLLLNRKAKKIDISYGSVNWEGIKSKAEGMVSYGDDQYSFTFKGSDQSLDSIINVLPSNFLGDLSDYSLSSTVSFNLKTENTSGKWLTNIEFKTRNGKVTHIPSAISFEKLVTSGNIVHFKENTSINLNSFSGIFSGGHFDGSFSMKNVKHPSILAELKGEFELSKLLSFFKNDEINNAFGSIKADLHFQGSFYDLKEIQKREIEKAITTGSIDFDQASFNLPRLNLELRELNGQFKLNDNDAEIPHLKGSWLGSEFTLDGSIKNFMPFLLLDNQKLIVRARGNIDHIDLEKLLTTSENEEVGESFKIPRYLSMSIDGKIRELIYKKFKANDVFGQFIIKDGRLISNDFGFNNAGGAVRANLFLQSRSNGELELHVQSSLKGLAINELFYEFENMGQKMITDQNINGVLDADVMFKGVWDKHLKIDLSKINVMANVLVKNGELKNVKTFEQIGEYLRSNPIASVLIDTKGLSKRLQNIHFDELQNQIEIKNRVITIPEMQILTDAVDINLSGRHDFDNNIDYAINFRLREIMKQKKGNEFNTIEDDGLGKRIFLKMEGTTTNPSFSLDKEAKKEWKKEHWKDEKKNIAEIIDQEVNTFLGGENGGQEKDAPVKYEIEWEEFSDTTIVETKTDSTKKKQKTLIFQSDDNKVPEDDDDDY